MSTEFELLLPGERTPHSQGAAQAAFAEIDRLESLFSRFDPRSEISRINRLQPGGSLRVGIEVVECLDLAFRLNGETGGAFDVDYRSRADRAAQRASDAEAEASGGAAWPVELVQVSDGFVVSALRSVDLDLGGIGKGYALDQVKDLLEDWDHPDALLHAGTSTALAWGDPRRGRERGKGGWPLGVGGPWACPEVPGRILLRDRALSGSGVEVKGEHVVDPASGGPASGHPAAWASFPSAAVADALSTAFMVMTAAQVEDFCRHHTEVWALVINGPKKCTIHNRGIVAIDPTP
jgi:thiamine biosynthesis lipoprotein